MMAMYSMLRMSKQNVCQKLARQSHHIAVAETVVTLARQIRQDHPHMGCRKMYWKGFEQFPLGRDHCERILLSRGFRVKLSTNFKRTTYAIGKLYYPNLIEGKRLDGLNQVWQSDITYFEVAHKFYYLVFIEDVYSRTIVGWSVDESLWADANIRALRTAITLRGTNLKGLIHHSDRGGQYIDKDYLKLLEQHQIVSSMCLHGWQNAYCERINGIIKNEYLKHWSINNFDKLINAVTRAVELYNNQRPHWALPNRLSPAMFEKKINAGLWDKRPIVQLYSSLVET